MALDNEVEGSLIVGRSELDERNIGSAPHAESNAHGRTKKRRLGRRETWIRPVGQRSVQLARLQTRFADLAATHCRQHNVVRTRGQRSEERRVGKECRSRWWSHH